MQVEADMGRGAVGSAGDGGRAGGDELTCTGGQAHGHESAIAGRPESVGRVEPDHVGQVVDGGVVGDADRECHAELVARSLDELEP